MSDRFAGRQAWVGQVGNMLEWACSSSSKPRVRICRGIPWAIPCLQRRLWFATHTESRPNAWCYEQHLLC